MKVYALTNAWGSSDAEVDGICYGVFSTEEKAREAMREAIEETKENWVECERVESEEEIEITESENACTLKSYEGEDMEVFKIEEVELDEVFND